MGFLIAKKSLPKWHKEYAENDEFISLEKISYNKENNDMEESGFLDFARADYMKKYCSVGRLSELRAPVQLEDGTYPYILKDDFYPEFAGFHPTMSINSISDVTLSIPSLEYILTRERDGSIWYGQNKLGDYGYYVLFAICGAGGGGGGGRYSFWGNQDGGGGGGAGSALIFGVDFRNIKWENNGTQKITVTLGKGGQGGEGGPNNGLDEDYEQAGYYGADGSSSTISFTDNKGTLFTYYIIGGEGGYGGLNGNPAIPNLDNYFGDGGRGGSGIYYIENGNPEQPTNITLEGNNGCIDVYYIINGGHGGTGGEGQSSDGSQYTINNDIHEEITINKTIGGKKGTTDSKEGGGGGASLFRNGQDSKENIDATEYAGFGAGGAGGWGGGSSHKTGYRGGSGGHGALKIFGSMNN